MGLAQTIFNSIKQNYFSVWDIISLIEQKSNNDLFDIGLFLGHISIEEHIAVYQRDKFYNLHEIDPNFNRNPLGEIIDCLMSIMPFDSDEQQQNDRRKVRSKSEHLFFAKQDIYNFNPIMDLGIIEKPQTQVVTLQSVQESRPDKYKFFLYKQPLFSIDECACIISDYDPLEVQKYPHNDIDEIAPDYSRAYSFIGSAIEANKLNVFNYKVDADGFREYLASENIIIAGFNDDLQGAELEKNTDASNIELQQLKLENEKLKAELAEKDQKIKELESLNQKNDMDLLSLIFDESATEIYAPDLVNAIKLWKYLYVDDKSANDSHSSRANHWMGKNTPYKGESSVDVKRLREVTSPFNSWHSERKNKLNK